MGKIASLFEHRVTRKVGEWVVVLLVLTWCAVLVARPINLATADLGRHIKNGEVISQTFKRLQNFLKVDLMYIKI